VTKALSIQVTEEHLEDLKDKAARLGVSVEDLARAGVLDLIRRPDDAFESAAARVLDKNSELYRRLA
jgi:hypothetical protein